MATILSFFAELLNLVRSYDMRRYATREELFNCRDQLRQEIFNNRARGSRQHDEMKTLLLNHIMQKSRPD